MLIGSLMAFIGVFPTTPEDSIGFDVGFILGLVLVIVGIVKR